VNHVFFAVGATFIYSIVICLMSYFGIANQINEQTFVYAITSYFGGIVAAYLFMPTRNLESK
jgi:hypothetical protein